MINLPLPVRIVRWLGLIIFCAFAAHASSVKWQVKLKAGEVAGDPYNHGFYLSAGYAMIYAPDERLEVNTGGTSGTAELDYDLGFRSSSLAAGYSFDNGFRAELEAGYRRNELEIIDFSDGRGELNTGAEDSVDAITGFANLYYEFMPRLAVRPFVGAGAGFASVRYKGSFSVLQRDERGESPLFDERDQVFAWQAIVGASIAFTPRTRLSAEYRYLQTGKLNFTSDSAATTQSSYRTRHKLHMLGIQLRYSPGADKKRQKSGYPNYVRARDVRAQDRSGFYTSTYFGVAAAEDSDIDDLGVDTNFDAFDIGPLGGVAVGYRWRSKRGTPLRVELEAQTFSNDADLVDFGFLAGESRLRGDARTRAIALNVLVESDRLDGLRPYAGVGVGFARVDYSVQLREPNADFPDRQFLDDGDDSQTVQALLGLRVALGPRLSANLGYRYWWAPQLKLQNPQGERVETEHSAHMITLGLQWNL